MSAWLVEQVVAAGGRNAGHPIDEERGEYLAEHRGFLLRWTWEALDIARVVGLDRWANSRLWRGETPTTIASINALLDGLDRTTPEVGA